VPAAPVVAPVVTTPSAPARSEPFYTRADVERILEAMYEITNLIQQKAVPARDAAQAFDRSWNEIILSQGDEAARLQLNAIRIQVQNLTDEGWSISNKYSHYNKEIGPVLGGMAFSEKFLSSIERFHRALESLPQNIDRRALTLLEPMRLEYQAGIGLLQKWMNDTYDRDRVATEQFRSMAQKNGSL